MEKRKLKAAREAVNPALTGAEALVGEAEEIGHNERVTILSYNTISHIIFPTG